MADKREKSITIHMLAAKIGVPKSTVYDNVCFLLRHMGEEILRIFEEHADSVNRKNGKIDTYTE